MPQTERRKNDRKTAYGWAGGWHTEGQEGRHFDGQNASRWIDSIMMGGMDGYRSEAQDGRQTHERMTGMQIDGHGGSRTEESISMNRKESTL